MRKKTKYLILGILFLTLFIGMFTRLISDSYTTNSRVQEYKKNAYNAEFNEFNTFIEEKKVKTIFFDKDSSVFYVEKDDNSIIRVINPEYDTFKKELLDKSIDVRPIQDVDEKIIPLVKNDLMWDYLFLLTITSVLFVLSLKYFIKFSNIQSLESARHTEKENDFLKFVVTAPEKDTYVDVQKPNKDYPKFKDIAGLHEVKKDVDCLVDFLKNKDKYTSAGAKLPKGVIFYGPPGTGKTLLARAIANEAGVPFHYMSGSDFAEMYVGVGAKRVRKLFADAKRTAPCIIFIDEIDAVGGKRDGDATHAEDRKTLNALLTEMDGFNGSENIIVIGATNQIDSLDDALLRPGRFTNKYCIPLPANVTERREVIDLYTKNKRFSDTVDFNDIAKETMGFSPAAIESYLNEAAIISVQDKKPCIDKEVLDKALVKMLLSGHIKENQSDRDKEELRTVAWHEAGHALMGKLNGKEIPKVTILASTSGAGGVTFTSPKTESGLHSVTDLKDEVKELYAGRIAELLFNGESKITTGASNDIERATHIIKAIVTSFGMSKEFGLLNLNHLNVSQDIIIEKEVKLAKELEKETTEILSNHFELLKEIAETLLLNETIYDADLDFIISKYVAEPALA